MAIASGVSRFRLINLREMTAHRGRSMASVLVIAVSAALLVVVLVTYGSITGSVDKLTKSIAGQADLMVTGYTEGGFDAALTKQVAAVPGVAVAAPVIQQPVTVADKTVTLLGFDTTVVGLHSDLAQSITADLHGGTALASRSDGVAVGAAMNLEQGQTVPLANGTATVVAVIHGAAAERINGGRFILAPLTLAQRLTGHIGSVDTVFVVGERDTDSSRLRTAIDAAIGQRAVVTGPEMRTAQAQNSVAITRNSTLLVSAVGLVIAGFLVFNSMNMVVAQRRPRMAMLRALGARRGQVVSGLLAEAAITGFIAAALGLPIGLLAARWAVGQAPSMLVQSISAQIGLVVPGYTYPVVFVVCVLTCLLASAAAAVQTYRISPLEALRSADLAAGEPFGLAVTVGAAVTGVLAATAALVLVGILSGTLLYVSAAVFVLAGLLLGIAGMRPIAAAATRLAARLGSVGPLAAAAMQRASRRTWATAITAAVAVTVGLSVQGALGQLVVAGKDSLAGLRSADLVVAGTPLGAVPAGVTLPAGWTQRVAAVSGVGAVHEGQWAYLTVGELRVMVEGISTAKSLAGQSMSDTVRSQVLNGDGIAVSRQFADRFGYHTGDQIEFGSPTGTHTVRIAGTTNTLSLDAGTVAMSLTEMQHWFDRPGATYLAIETQPGADLDTVRRAVTAALPATAHVYTGQASYDETVRNIEQAGALSNGLRWIVAAIAVIALMNTFTLAVLQRRREVAVLRAIGSSRRTAARMILIEAAAVGCVGAVCGIALGAAVQYLAVRVTSRAMGIDVAFHLSPTVAGYLGIGVAVCLAGALFPALRASRANIVTAMKFE